VVNKASKLANRALNTAKKWTNKVLSSAKRWGKKLWNGAKNSAKRAWTTARNWAGKAWSTARSWAAKAWSSAKSWGSKAVSTAKRWAGKAWSKAKSWAGKAWSKAKSLAGKAWNTAKSWAGKAWSTVKGWAGKAWDGVKWLGGKAWGYAKWMGGKALTIAKKLGLDKAWKKAKDLAGKAWKKIKDAGAALKKRFGPYFDTIKKYGAMAAKASFFLSPSGWSLGSLILACKTLTCAISKIVKKSSKTTQDATDLATDITPGVGTVKDTCACITGENVTLGKDVGLPERGISCASAAIDIVAIIGAAETGGVSVVGGMAAKGWLKGLLKKGGKEILEQLLEKSGKELAKELLEEGGDQALKKLFKEGGEEALEKVAKKLLEEGGEEAVEKLAKQLAKSGDKELAEKLMKELAEKRGKEAAEKEAKKLSEKKAAEVVDENLAAKHATADGHEIKITKNGKIFVCSDPCEEFATKYSEVLSKNRDLDDELKRISKITNPDEQAKELADLKVRVDTRKGVMRKADLSTERGKSTPKTKEEADAILQAEAEGKVTGKARRPDPSAGEPDLDFAMLDEHGKVINYVDIKTPIDSKLRAIAQQAADTAGKVTHYDPDVDVIINLKNLSKADKATFLLELKKNGVPLSRVKIING
jgi:hypothetical protein